MTIIKEIQLVEIEENKTVDEDQEEPPVLPIRQSTGTFNNQASVILKDFDSDVEEEDGNVEDSSQDDANRELKMIRDRSTVKVADGRVSR